MASMRVGIVAGEASGDLLGSNLIKALRARMPDIEFVGIGGPKMIAAGMRSLYPMETLSVRGYVEAVRSLPAILRIRRNLKRYLLDNPPALFIGVDAPDFNLGLERALKRAGIPTVHYVGPSLWAWRGGRIHNIKRAVSRMLLVFPFEQALYDRAGVPATYVGHPLADLLPLDPERTQAREQLKLPPHAKIVAMLPGSRQGELRQLADLFVATAQTMHREKPDLRFLVPLVTKETRLLFEEAIYRREAHDLPITILFGHAHEAMTAANVVLVASGTATLEAALLKRPMVIAYRVPWLTYYIMWPRRYLPYIGLPNVLAGRFLVPEILQNDATADNLSQALCNLLGDAKLTAALEEEFRRMHESLRCSNAERAAEVIQQVLAEQAHA